MTRRSLFAAVAAWFAPKPKVDLEAMKRKYPLMVYEYRSVGSITADVGPWKTYGMNFESVEVGLFSGPKGRLINRTVFASQPVKNGEPVAFTYKVTPDV